MAIDLFRVQNGFGVFGRSSILSGSGAPGGDTSFQDAAAQGSIFLRTDISGIYLKVGTANSTADWTKLLSSAGQYIIAPADAADSTLYANLAAAVSAYNGTNTVDGVTITSGFRILLTNLTSGTETVYDVTGSSGAWTLTADTSFTPTAGDEIYIIDGTTYGGDIFTYDGANWQVQSGSTIFNELGYIRTFIGKNAAGNETPDYSSNNYVTDGTSLETAIGAIDNAVFTAIGNRTYTNPNFITSSQSITASLQALDSGLEAFGQSAVSSTVTTATTVDTVNCRKYDCVLWVVKCVDHSSPANKETVQIFATHDATPSVDATVTDFNVASILTVGTPPTGLGFDVTLSGTGASQVMNLRVTSTTSVDVKVARVRL